MKKFLVLLIAVSLLLVFYTPVMARGGHGGGSYHGGHGGYRGGWVGPFVGGAIIGGALGYYGAPRYGYSYGGYTYPTCIGYVVRYDQWGQPIQVPVRVPCY